MAVISDILLIFHKAVDEPKLFTIRPLTHTIIFQFEPIDHQNRPVYAEFRKFPRLYFYGKAGTSPFYSAPHQNSATAGTGTNTNLNKTTSVSAIPSLTHTTTSVNRQKSGLRRMFRENTKVNRQNVKTANTM
jgi:hypothetical protein